MKNTDKEVYFKVLSKSDGPFRDITEGKVYKGYYVENNYIQFTDDVACTAIFDTQMRYGKYELVDGTLIHSKNSPRYHRPRVKPPELKRNKLVITYLDVLYSQYTLKDVISAVVKAEVVSITYKKIVAGYETRINIDIPTKDLSSLEYKTPKGKTLILFKEGVTYSANNKTIQL